MPPERSALKRRSLLAAAPLLLLPRAGRAATALPAMPEDQAVIAFGHIGPIADGGWTTTHHRARLAAQAAYPKARFLEVESIPVSADATRVFRQFVENGANLVFVSSEYGDLLSSVADDAEQTGFLECNGHRTTANEGWYYIQHWKVSYIIGVAAAHLSRSAKLGFVGSFPVPSVFACANAFLLGAQSVRPDATVQVVLINSWFDPQAASQAAGALIASGIDMLYTNLDDASCLQVAAKAGIRCATWNTDRRALGPDAYVTSLLLDWNRFTVDQIAARLAGRWTGNDTVLLPVGGGVDRDAWGSSVPAAASSAADAVRTRILGGWNPIQGEIRDASGTIRVHAGQSLDEMACYGWNWPVQGVLGLK